jgi:two-component system, NarL family, response regulator DevR
VKVMLVDNHPVTLLGMRTLLSESGVDDISEAPDAEAALTLAGEERPDLVVLDSDLGEENGLEVCREIKTLPDAPKVVVYTARTSREDVAEACLAGADGYLYKGAEREKLAEIVEKTNEGERNWVLGPDGGGTDFQKNIEAADLTPKEREILALLLDRNTNRGIADKLRLSENTVKTHVHSVLKKLHLHSRQELFGARRDNRGPGGAR